MSQLTKTTKCLTVDSQLLLREWEDERVEAWDAYERGELGEERLYDLLHLGA